MAMLWNGKDLGTPLAIACRVAKGTASPAAGDKGPLEIRRVPAMPGIGAAEVTKRASSGWRLKARSTLETPPGNGESPKLKPIAGSLKPAPEKARWIRSSISASGSFLLATNVVSRATRMDTLPIWRRLTTLCVSLPEKPTAGHALRLHSATSAEIYTQIAD